MGKFIINKVDAGVMHQDNYSGSFELVFGQRKGVFDYFPWNLMYGLSDAGCWDVILSSDGDKVVVTKSGIKASKIKQTWQLKKSDIENVSLKPVRNILTLKFRNKVKGLTTMDGGEKFFTFGSMGIGLLKNKPKELAIRLDSEADPDALIKLLD
jgi:hypothetical protein